MGKAVLSWNIISHSQIGVKTHHLFLNYNVIIAYFTYKETSHTVIKIKLHHTKQFLILDLNNSVEMEKSKCSYTSLNTLHIAWIGSCCPYSVRWKAGRRNSRVLSGRGITLMFILARIPGASTSPFRSWATKITLVRFLLMFRLSIFSNLHLSSYGGRFKGSDHGRYFRACLMNLRCTASILDDQIFEKGLQTTDAVSRIERTNEK